MNRFPPDPHIPIIERPEREVGATVADVMTVDVLTAAPGEEVSVVLAALQAAGHRSVPVVEADRVVVVTYRDLVHALARDDALIAADVQRRLDLYGGPARWTVSVSGGEATNGGTLDRSVALRVVESVLGVTACRFID
jgi:CBS domain-containing protein